MDIDASQFSAPAAAPDENHPFTFSFEGSGGEYFGIVIVNWLLTVLTLGLYYPWAKARKLSYLYSSTEFQGSRFAFHGTGQEMFKGFIKAILILILLVGLFIYLSFLKFPVIAFLFLYGGIFLLLPFAIHGSYKYRFSRTSWRGIRMGYRGDRGELFRLFFKGILLTVVTFGFYGAWFSMNLRNYLLNRVRFGNLNFRYQGRGSDYFMLNFKGYFLTLLTLGIYAFWWQKDLFEYYVNNLSLENEKHNIRLKSQAIGGQFFGLIITNFLLLIFTFGLATPWIMTRTLRYLFSKVEVSGNMNLDMIMQTEMEYTDATGEDLTDLLDFGFVI